MCLDSAAAMLCQAVYATPCATAAGARQCLGNAEPINGRDSKETLHREVPDGDGSEVLAAVQQNLQVAEVCPPLLLVVVRHDVRFAGDRFALQLRNGGLLQLRQEGAARSASLVYKTTMLGNACTSLASLL